MSEAHDTDVVEWCQRQSELLRRVAAGEKINETPDWANIIEEIEDLGANAIRAVRSHLLQAILHELKIRAWPDSRDVPHRRSEVRLQRGQAADEYTPSMRQSLEVAAIYHRALRALPETMSDQLPLEVPEICPWTLAELLSDEDLPVSGAHSQIQDRFR